MSRRTADPEVLHSKQQPILSMPDATLDPITATKRSVTEKLDALFAPWNRSDAPGVIVGAAHQGRVIYRRAFGLASIEQGTALTPATRMRIGSTTKQFCALGILLLAEEGKLDIEKPISTWLPELGAVCGRPTLLQLMQHTGGLHDPLSTVFLQNGGYYTELPAGSHLQMMSRIETCNFEPGSRFAYSNSGYQLLSLLTERLSGQSWAEFLDARVFQPMGMRDTAVLASDLDIVPNMAGLHVHTPHGAWRRGIYPSDENLGGGGIISTVDDMLLWAAHLRSAQKKVGSEALWRQMLEPQTFANGSRHCYALGLMRDAHRGVATIHHAGATMGSTHQMLTAPKQALDIIVMSNRMDVSSTALALKVLEAVLEDEGLAPSTPLPHAADYPALPGRWYSRQSRMLIEVAARKLVPDQPELLLLSTYNQPIGTLQQAGEGLALPDGPFSTIEFRALSRATTPAATLGVHLCGELEPFERLPETPPSAESLAAALCGRYRQPGYDKQAEITLRDGKLVLDLLPLHGRAYWELQPYSEDVLGCGNYQSIPQFMLPNSASLTVKREDGQVIGFWYDTDRIRGLWFERVRVPARNPN